MLNQKGSEHESLFGKGITMNTSSERRRRGLHLVTSAAKNPNDRFDYQIALGVLQLRNLEDEFADEAISTRKPSFTILKL